MNWQTWLPNTTGFWRVFVATSKLPCTKFHLEDYNQPTWSKILWEKKLGSSREVSAPKQTHGISWYRNISGIHLGSCHFFVTTCFIKIMLLPCRQVLSYISIYFVYLDTYESLHFLGNFLYVIHCHTVNRTPKWKSADHLTGKVLKFLR